MEENKTKQTVSQVECTKCHKKVKSTEGKQTSNGFTCNKCIAQKRHKKNGTIVSVIIIAAIAGWFYYTSSDTRTAAGFDGVSDVIDTMNVNVDSVKVSFNLSETTATSSPVSTQEPISDLAEFKRIMKSNIKVAEDNNDNKILIPSVAVMFSINTNYFVNDGIFIIDEFADVYLRTNKQAKILVEGYTCDLGGDSLNNNLSRVRAEAAKNILIEDGVSEDNIETKWYGKSRYTEFSYLDKSDYRRVIITIE